MTMTPAILLTAAVTILAIVLYFYTGVLVAQMRTRHNIKAPACAGHPQFDRAFRVQMNTLEALPVFLPLLWLTAVFFQSWGWAAPACGLAWTAGRILYMQGYMKDPDSRGIGFGISVAAQVVLLVLAVIGICQAWAALS